ncbi:MAG: hypothetical protein WC655_08585 [Candidatus Hydrogenedentales bacterium]|jgi:hypothetical protein
MMGLVIKVLGFWFLLLVIAVASGGLRTAFLQPALGELRAHQAGTLIVCVVFAALIAWFTHATTLTPRQAILVGVLWVAMTVAFETGMVRIWMGRPWGDVFADYNLLKGRIWPLVLLTVLAVPYIVASLWPPDRN